MRHASRWGLAVVLAATLLGCGQDHTEDDVPDSAEQTVGKLLDALARGEAHPLCNALDWQEAYAASAQTVPFKTFVEQVTTACAEHVGDIYSAGESEHQVIGQYAESGHTFVKVRFRKSQHADWVEWDLPLRHIDGFWRLGFGGFESMVGVVVVPWNPSSVDAPAADPVPDEIEQKALAIARDFVAQGGDVNQALAESYLLDEPAMDVTRLHVAAERGWLTVVRYLVEQGAGVLAVAPSKSHHNQLTPLDVARHAGHPHVAAYLEQVGAPEPRKVARAFVEASRKGDLNAAAALCTRKAAGSLLPAAAEGDHQPAIREFDVRNVEVTGEQAVADVWVRNGAFPDGEDEFMLVLTLMREEGAWLVDDLALEPYWDPADLGPEVDR